KLSNLVFTPAGEGLCLVDLDTVAVGPLAPELGDAFRSWCNPGGEDGERGRFSLPIFEAALAGYAAEASAFLTGEETASVVSATETIYLELAARFAADALHERYFGWDSARFASRGEHNLARATNQLEAVRSLAERRAEAEAIVARAFAGRLGQ